MYSCSEDRQVWELPEQGGPEDGQEGGGAGVTVRGGGEGWR